MTVTREVNSLRKGVKDEQMDRIYTLRGQLRTARKNKKRTVLVAKKMFLLATLAEAKYNEKKDILFDKEYKKYVNEALKLADELIKAHKVNRHLKDDEVTDIIQVKRMCHNKLARQDFHHFLIALEWGRPPEKKFYPPRIEILRPLVQDIQDLWDRKIKLLALSLPAGIGKSTLGIFAMAWVIGMDWEKPNLMTGYGSQLTSSFYMGVKSVITDPEYCFNKIFPEIQMVRSDAKDGILDFRGDGRKETRRIPTLQTISIEGAVTGRGRCANLLYSDDLVNGIEEGLNRDRLETKWMKYANDFRSRAKKGYVELIIGTRWSIHDPIGKLEQLYGENNEYKFIAVPALDEDGESNFDFKYGVGFDKAYYEDLKEVMDEISFMCQCQQQPIERDGLAFAESELKRYFVEPQDTPDEIMAFCDVAFGGGDFLSFPVVKWWGDDGYVTEVVFDKSDYHMTQPRVAACILNNKIQRAEFEANNGGEFYAKDIATELKKSFTHKCNVTSKRAASNKSKMARIIQMKPDIKQLYFKDKSMYKSNDDYGKFMKNLTTFVETGKNRNDDAPDSLAGLMGMIRKRSKAEVIIGNRKGLGL